MKSLKNQDIKESLLALEDGKIFKCQSFTGHGEASGEIVFNTSMTGYQEILTDPSYRNQMVTMTYPLIGNYGANLEDIESEKIQVSAFLVKEYQDFPSNFRSKFSLGEYLKSQNIIGLTGLDTRAITKHIRDFGAKRAFISTKNLDQTWCINQALQVPSMIGQDIAKEVTTNCPYFWENNKANFINPELLSINKNIKNIWKQKANKKSIVAFDFGIKYNILRCLEARNLEILIIPAQTKANIIKSLDPDGIFLSNGPGDPEPVSYAIETIRELINYKPIFGICLGHQLLGLALGAKTFKLKFGHRGANQPVKNLKTGKIEITSQNHGFVVDINSLNNQDFEITHINLNDKTLEGFMCEKYKIIAVQYHPEASPGPHDANYMFDNFVNLLK